MTRHFHERSDSVPNVQVALPAALTSPEPAVVLDCDAGTVAEALRAAVAQAPRYEQRLFFNDRLLVSIVLNGRHLAPAAAQSTPLADGDRVDVLPPVAGG
jgi:molybdopterin converting factor small subunit